ncbi:MAG: PAS domain S-box protein [Pseudomonadota bacterium]|nr:PAS domain S-box protein [Pseudomonadota bacterium]
MKHANLQADDLPKDEQKTSLLTQALEHIPEVFYCTDEDGKLLYVNAHGCDLFGLDRDKLLGKSVFDIHPELSQRRWSTATQAAREKGQWVIRLQQSLYTKEPAPVEMCLGHQCIDGNDRFFCITRVVSKLDQSERLLNLISQCTAGYSGLEFFRALMKHMAEVMHVNKAFITECLDQPPSRVRMLAFWSADMLADNMEYDLIGTPCDTVINERQDFLVEEHLGEVYPKEKGFAESYYGVPIYDAAGHQVIGHMAFLDDHYLTIDGLDCTVFEILASRASVELQRMHAEDALKRSEANYRLLVENQTDLIMRLDTLAKLAFVSPSCCARLGRKESELLGNEIFSFIHSDESNIARVAWQQALAPPYKASCELRTLTSQGWCWFAWILKGVIDVNGTISEVIAVGRDVSERVHAEDQARDTIRKLAHVGRLSSMGEMASGIAHELNQPLTAIMSFAQASRRMLDSNSADIVEYKAILERIAANAKLAGEIIQRVRGFVRKTEPNKAPVELRLLIHEVTGLLSSELRHGDIQLSLHVDDALPRVSGDPIQIQQVLVNLLRNAIEAITEHNAWLREISISAKVSQQKNVIVEVHDTGPGIPAEVQKQLFDAFITTKPEGLGVGLSICHTIIEAHGGTLCVESLAGEGTVFRFTLTAFKEEQDP